MIFRTLTFSSHFHFIIFESNNICSSEQKHRFTTSDNLLISIQEKIKWADTMSELDKKHRKEVEERMDEVKKSVSLKVSTMHFSVTSLYVFAFWPFSLSII